MVAFSLLTCRGLGLKVRSGGFALLLFAVCLLGLCSAGRVGAGVGCPCARTSINIQPYVGCLKVSVWFFGEVSSQE